ncbi:Leucine-rich repeat protein kinase family protein [Forsythia ovata]|uniref:Leucine-rich repeat protein kinase family protein n=1 Tax=Forsythia ovata TaxID=205694 RepID=A0ABD1TAR4_9LAMI
MFLKLFPVAGTDHSSLFNTSEILRIRSIFTTWELPRDDFYGPYELLNFTLVGPYSYVNFNTQGKGIRKGLLISIIVGDSCLCRNCISNYVEFTHKMLHKIPYAVKEAFL